MNSSTQWFGVGAGFVTGAWLTQVYKRPSLSLHRASFFTAALAMTGHGIGTALKFRAHLRFTTSLEGPDNFINALENINRKQGNPRPLGFTLATAMRKQQSESELDPIRSHEFEEGSGLEFVNENDLPPEANTNREFNASYVVSRFSPELPEISVSLFILICSGFGEY